MYALGPWQRDLARWEYVQLREKAIAVGSIGTDRTRVALGRDWPRGSAGCPWVSRRSVALAWNRSLRYSASAASGSILVTTDLSSGDWIGFCGWERVTGALVDRLTHHVHMLETSGEGHRFEFSRWKTVAEGADKPDETRLTSAPISFAPTLPSVLQHSSSSHYSWASPSPASLGRDVAGVDAP